MVTIAMAERQSILNNYATQFGAYAQLAIFSGVVPTNADTALSGNAILAAIPFSTTPFAAATAATPSVLTANTITQENSYTTGTATFYRAYAEGTSTAATALAANSVYMIQSVGTTTFTSYGAPANTVGTVFVANGVGTGTGTAFLMNTIEQGTVGTSGADCNLNTTAIVAAGPTNVTSFYRNY